MTVSKERESTFELIRLIAMFMIVLYHIYFLTITPIYDSSFNRAIWIPLHIGVPLFVLISGYFGIRVSGRGLAKLLGQMLVYTAVFLIIYYYLTNTGGGIRNIIRTFMLVSNSPRWFMRTYICLYLFSPVINSYLKDITPKQRLYIIFILLFISVYIGTFGDDPSLSGGKNLVHFILLYIVGNTLRVYENIWRKISLRKLIIAYVLLNVLLVTGYCFFDGTFISHKIFNWSFPYSSPIILLNSILFFIIIAKNRFQSKLVNYLAASTLGIYLLHCSSLVKFYTWIPASLWIKSFIPNDYVSFCALAVLALAVVFACIFIDKLFTPLWGWFQRVGEKAEIKIVSFVNQHV